jgi:hypothetical protein
VRVVEEKIVLDAELRSRCDELLRAACIERAADVRFRTSEEEQQSWSSCDSTHKGSLLGSANVFSTVAFTRVRASPVYTRWCWQVSEPMLAPDVCPNCTHVDVGASSAG